MRANGIPLYVEPVTRIPYCREEPDGCISRAALLGDNVLELIIKEPVIFASPSRVPSHSVTRADTFVKPLPSPLKDEAEIYPLALILLPVK